MSHAPPATPDRVVIINDASVARGGATGLALLAAREIRALGLRVTYVAGDSGAAPDLADLGIEVIATGGARLLDQPRLKSATAGLWNAAARAAIADLVAQDTPGTVYHVHGWAQILSPAIFAALAPVAPRVVVHAHDRFLACPNGVYHDFGRDRPCARAPLGAACLATDCDKHSYARKLWRVARQLMLRRAFDQRRPWGAIVLIHPRMAGLMEDVGYPPQRLCVLRNPASPYTESRVRAEENRALAFIGRIEREKGLAELAEAARRARLPLMVIGEGRERAPLATAYPEIRFEGWQDRAGIARLIKGARAVIVPGRIPEPFGLVIAEASFSGLPLLVSDSAFLAAEIDQAGLGRSFDMRAPNGLDAALTRFRDLSDAEVRTISERAFARPVPLAQTTEAWVKGLLALYRRVL
ncbi:hypothetical protein U879_16885 [Defluviimonas sp. 20V17]|uniref:Glycosyltransferase involved in cell wall bisynthesis n=1 Tax=Allgaiera indica TaxID=765699 RepID=A0AAN4USA4_9RHOB|nr:glycosyltransferase [Allgaiera indica]KDB02506.1 hypothetical protein U879_16885 [Defluviimonas sp. 20V17]GHE01969.1 polysaccharide biosynthesis protein [Allgaiera indica]SDX02711.1 Glycosyltransferase involved in cell wall bisynthesis [Allgaiera indica]